MNSSQFCVYIKNDSCIWDIWTSWTSTFHPPPEGNFLVKPYVCQIYLALTCFSQYQNLLDPQQRSWPAEPACCCCVRAFDERPR